MIKTGFAKEIISPGKGIPLAGYFTPRPNKGVLDDLYVKSVFFESNGNLGGIVSFDLCFISKDIIEKVKNLLLKVGLDFGYKILFCATHTHTGPYPCDFFGTKCDEKYLEYLVVQTVSSIKKAYANLTDSQLYNGSIIDNPFAFNRRYFMKDGKVTTNPGKLNPDIVESESKVDREIGLLTVKQNDMTSLIIANIVNHTDTIGGDLVSADWPGRMEKEIQKKIGYDVPVITLIGCSGNINHFDVSTKRNQTSYREANRIGKGYANIILKKLDSFNELKGEFLITSQSIEITGRTILDEEVSLAKEILRKPEVDNPKGDITSEGLAKGEGYVARFFAEQLLNFKKTQAGKTRIFDQLTLKFGKDLAIISMPGEPFSEIGMSIKKASAFKKTFVVSHGMGKAGYIPLKECFGRGGYETLPVENGGCSPDTAEQLINASCKKLGGCHNSLSLKNHYFERSI